MSRTNRKDSNDHKTGYYKETGDLDKYGNPEHRDKKSGDKPPGWFKKLRRRIRRAKAKMAMRNGKEPEREKNNDQWDWT